MAKLRGVKFDFPSGGLYKGTTFRQQPPNTTPDCENVRAGKATGARVGDGQRAGMGKVYTEELGSGNPIRMLGHVTTAKQTGVGAGALSDTDEFDREAETLGAGWATGSWLSDSLKTTAVGDGNAYVERGVEAANVREDLNLDVGALYRVRALIEVPRSQGNTTYVRVYARMDDSSPDIEQDGVVADLKLVRTYGGDTSYEGSLKVYIGSALNSEDDFEPGTPGTDPIWFEMRISSDNVKVYLDGTVLLNADISSQAGTRVGLGLKNTVFAEWPLRVWEWNVVGGTVGAGETVGYRTYLVASANNVVYSEQDVGELAAVSGNAANVSADHSIMCADRGQRLYIADYDPSRVAGSDGTFAAGGTDLTATGVSDWTALSIDVDTDVLVVTRGTSNVVAGTYEISSVEESKLVTSSSVGGSGNCTYRVARGPKIYNPIADSVALWTAASEKGEVPTGCPIFCAYRDRPFFGGSETDPHEWYMGRQGDWTDFNYSGGGVQRAIRGTDSDAGKVGDVLKAAIPFADDFLVLGCLGSIWLMTGDPGWGGTLSAISYEVGMLDKFAWCFGPSGEIYFLSWAGLYRMRVSGGNAALENLSEGALPGEFRNVSTQSNEVILDWNEDDEGVDVFITPNSADAGVRYFWHSKPIRSGGVERSGTMWRDALASDHGPTAVHGYKSTSLSHRKRIVGGRDGYLRAFDRKAKNDDGTAIASYIVYPPQLLGGSDYIEGILTSLEAILADDTDSLDYEILPGRTHEEAVAATAVVNGTWSPGGRTQRLYPRVRAGSVAIKLENANSGETWAIEGMVGVAKPVGRHRLT